MMKKAYAELNRPWVTCKTRVVAKFVNPLRIYFGWLTLGFLLLLPIVWADRRIRPLLAFTTAMFIALALRNGSIRITRLRSRQHAMPSLFQELRHIQSWRRKSFGTGNRSGLHTVLAGNYRWRGRVCLDFRLGDNTLVSLPGSAPALNRVSKAGRGKTSSLSSCSEDHDPHQEWVYNRADINAAPVVWARETPRGSLSQLIQYFADRQVWILEPDHAVSGPLLLPYTK